MTWARHWRFSGGLAKIPICYIRLSSAVQWLCILINMKLICDLQFYFFSLWSGYRSDGDETVWIKCWVCHSSGTVMVVKQTHLHLLCECFRFDSHHGASVPSIVHNRAVPPDNLHSARLFSRTSNILNIIWHTVYIYIYIYISKNFLRGNPAWHLSFW